MKAVLSPEQFEQWEATIRRAPAAGVSASARGPRWAPRNKAGREKVGRCRRVRGRGGRIPVRPTVRGLTVLRLRPAAHLGRRRRATLRKPPVLRAGKNRVVGRWVSEAYSYEQTYSVMPSATAISNEDLPLTLKNVPAAYAVQSLAPAWRMRHEPAVMSIRSGASVPNLYSPG